MGSTTCSDPDFAVLQAWETGKRQFLYTSPGIVHPNSTGHNSNDEPLTLFSAISNHVPALFTLCCCSACKFGLQGCFPISACSTCLSACSICFSIQNTKRGWLAAVTDRQHRCVYCTCHHAEKEAADQTCYHQITLLYWHWANQSQQWPYWSICFEVTGMTQARERPMWKAGLEPSSAVLEVNVQLLGHRHGAHELMTPMPILAQFWFSMIKSNHNGPQMR